MARRRRAKAVEVKETTPGCSCMPAALVPWSCAPSSEATTHTTGGSARVGFRSSTLYIFIQKQTSISWDYGRMQKVGRP